MRFLFSAGLLFLLVSMSSAQTHARYASPDSDHDGVSDAIENMLLTQFAPHFMVSGDDCSLRPAEFVPSLAQPKIQNENGTIYGQAFPRAGNPSQVELHYYHLWRRDCGTMGHNLDAEHVSALVARDDSASWKALYWYAAAHENTVCDASQIARASSVDGEAHGPEVWISRAKHGSFLSSAICTHGCGGDQCLAMEPLAAATVINLGERSLAMNGATWVDSPQWPLAEKMSHSDFTLDRTARADQLPNTSIAWANPGKRPMQSAIHTGNSALAGTSAGLNATGSALDTASSSTGDALGTATANTESGLVRSTRGVKKALHATARKLGMTNPQ